MTSRRLLWWALTTTTLALMCLVAALLLLAVLRPVPGLLLLLYLSAVGWRCATEADHHDCD